MDASTRQLRPNVRVLIEQTSPNGNVLATVEEQAGAIYLYLHGAEGTAFAGRACWVRNLRPAPANLDIDAMNRGQPPLMPTSSCAHPDGAASLDPEKLGLVWLEEGDAVALFEDHDLLAMIPGWAGHNDFHGYARDCTARTRLAWPLKGTEALLPRLSSAQDFWRPWSEDKPWGGIRDGILSVYSRAFGTTGTQYYAIDGGKWPPRAIARYEMPHAAVLVTLGMSIRPQPTVEMYVEDPRPLRRIELGLALDRREFNDEDASSMLKYLAGQANLPWSAYSWMGAGHTIELDAGPLGAAFDAMMLLKSPSGAPPVVLPNYRDDPVSLLWMVPVTESERHLSAEKGSGELMARLAARFPLWPVRKRDGVV